jgi:hypothetical protein
MTTCMICNSTDRLRSPSADDGSHVCPSCARSHAHLLDDDDDLDGRSDARHLTILAIDLDE